jgi:hypothetical protein
MIEDFLLREGLLSLDFLGAFLEGDLSSTSISLLAVFYSIFLNGFTSVMILVSDGMKFRSFGYIFFNTPFLMIRFYSLGFDFFQSWGRFKRVTSSYASCSSSWEILRNVKGLPRL